MKLSEVIEAIDELYPFSSQEDWDNSGMQLGDPDAEISTVLTALDLNEETVYEAKKNKAELIVTHHPLFFKDFRSIDRSKGKGRLIASLIKADIAVVSCHTNLDKAAGGVSAVLGKELGLTLCCPFCPTENGGSFGVIGIYPDKMTLGDFAAEVKKRLHLDMIRVVGNKHRLIRTVAVMGGAGSDFIPAAVKAGADVYVTGDLKYHQGEEAAALGLCLIDAGHFDTEVHVIEPFTEKMAAAMPTLRFIVAEKMKSCWHVL